MKKTFYKFLKQGAVVMLMTGIMASCNKDVADPTPITTSTTTSTQTIGDILNEPSYSVLKAAVTKANLLQAVSDSTALFTLFAPTDAAFALAGINSMVIAALPQAQVEAIVRYHLVGGQRVTSDSIGRRLPNLQLPTSLVLAPPSAAVPPGLRMSIFPSKMGNSFYVNNIPLTSVDQVVANGIIHKPAALVAPPTTTVKGFLSANSSKYSLLLAAIARADSGQVAGLNRLDSALNFAPANLTVFAPNNSAFRALFPPGTPDAAIIGALNNHAAFPVQTVRAIVAYHLLGNRYFSVNFPMGATTVNTQLVIPTTPPTVVPVRVTYTGATFTTKGLANTTESNVITRDGHAVNGTIHEIDQVMRPQ